MADAPTRFVVISVLLALSFMGSLANPAGARPLSSPSSRHSQVQSLASRLKVEDENSSNCWDSLIQIQACSGEIVLFFINGETSLGDGCCNAIRTIRTQCWPNMIGTLGFTAAEGDILEGYCDHETREEPNSGAVNSVSESGLVP